MASAEQSILDRFGQSGQSGIESALASLGMGSPSGRFIAGFTIGSIIAWALRPNVAFNPDSIPRPFTPLADDSEKAESTFMTWWMLGIMGGAVFSTFI
jgi:hypothetical protein